MRHISLATACAVVWSAVFGCGIRSAEAHDTWVQSSTPLVRVGEVTHVDLMLGNHGNNHRDFKLASKITLEPCTLSVIEPSGRVQDLKSGVVDLGYAPKEGFWSVRVVPQQAGVHTIVHTLDTTHFTTRALKSAKTYFLAATQLDDLAADADGPVGLPGEASVATPLGHPLEIVLHTAPTRIAAGTEFEVQVLFEGRPLSDVTISSIPRGRTLAEGFDAAFERKTDRDGKARFSSPEGTFVLLSVHHREPERRGEGFDATAYGATLVLNLPQRPLVAADHAVRSEEGGR